ncbi:unnamed protein product [Paramecium primaurelia]|uniref:WD40-repeat-containing domain n=1 Tax=Paramecium primaurelia TaxID=5886 RepID=A0A8S1N1R3_PARPR|nr:unnamed protein product [Paramecium primaurelia]
MNKNYKHQSCLVHKGLEFIALNQNKQEFDNKQLCIKCLAETSKQKVILITESLEQIREITSNLKQERNNQKERNVQIINELMDKVQNLKNSYIQQFEKISCTLEKWVQMIQNQEEEFNEKIDTNQLIDIDEFFKFAQELGSQKLSYNEEFKLDLKNKLEALIQNNLIINCIQSLQNLESIKNEFQVNDDDNDLQIECEYHQKEKIILFDLNEVRSLKKRIACVQCVDEFPSTQYKSIKFVQAKWKQVQTEKQENMNNNSKILLQKVDNIIDCFDQIKQNYIKIIEDLKSKIKENFNEYINEVRDYNYKLQQNWSHLSKEQICEIAENLSKPNKSKLTQDPLIKQFQQQNKFINKSVKDTLLYLQECEIILLKKINFSQNPFRIDELEKLKSTQLCQDDIDNESYQNIIETNNPSLVINLTYNYSQNNLPYELQSDKSIKYSNWCHAITFNKDCSIMLTGCNEQINVYVFEDYIRKQQQVLYGHSGCVTVLQFMNINNSFISASADSSILIWQYNLNNFWFCQQQLKGHFYQINCLLVNQDENTIFSSGDDKQIIIWKNDQQWEISQSIQDHTFSVYGLSLNDSQNKLISCGFDHFILIFEYSQQNKYWSLVQKILTNSGGYRLGFINDNQFTFQPINQDVMEVYLIDIQSQLYTKTQGIKIKKGFDQNCFFPQQYIKQKQLIINKSGQCINIIRVLNSGQLIVEQCIEFQTNYIFGALCDNGDYLVTWDYVTKELQVRKYQE